MGFGYIPSVSSLHFDLIKKKHNASCNATRIRQIEPSEKNKDLKITKRKKDTGRLQRPAVKADDEVFIFL